MVHRDLEPANVLLGPGGEPRLLDFGLAKLADAAGGPTRSGDVLGTPAYLAPEAIDAGPEASSPPVDVYGLGAILFEMLPGEGRVSAGRPSRGRGAAASSGSRPRHRTRCAR